MQHGGNNAGDKLNYFCQLLMILNLISYSNASFQHDHLRTIPTLQTWHYQLPKCCRYLDMKLMTTSAISDNIIATQT